MPAPALPPLPSLECVIALQRAGFEVTAMTPERVVLERDGRHVVIRRHTLLEPAELSLLLRAARLSPEELLELISPAPRHASGVRPRVTLEDEAAARAQKK